MQRPTTRDTAGLVPNLPTPTGKTRWTDTAPRRGGGEGPHTEQQRRSMLHRPTPDVPMHATPEPWPDGHGTTAHRRTGTASDPTGEPAGQGDTCGRERGMSANAGAGLGEARGRRSAHGCSACAAESILRPAQMPHLDLLVGTGCGKGVGMQSDVRR